MLMGIIVKVLTFFFFSVCDPAEEIFSTHCPFDIRTRNWSIGCDWSKKPHKVIKTGRMWGSGWWRMCEASAPSRPSFLVLQPSEHWVFKHRGTQSGTLSSSAASMGKIGRQKLSSSLQNQMLSKDPMMDCLLPLAPPILLYTKQCKASKISQRLGWRYYN